ncbi:MAG: hypothetical protein NXH75_07450 [Halobacteriovoraceae bacterium]|nr:hypothetical protein [Halobacteriovoraceae bacterium]
MENTAIINAENWTYSGYKSSNLLAFIHLGAEPTVGEDEVQLLYLVTVLKELEEEVFQMEHPSLPQALDDINRRYRHWDFVDRTKRLDEGGCGTCEAH